MKWAKTCLFEEPVEPVTMGPEGEVVVMLELTGTMGVVDVPAELEVEVELDPGRGLELATKLELELAGSPPPPRPTETERPMSSFVIELERNKVIGFGCVDVIDSVVNADVVGTAKDVVESAEVISCCLDSRA